MLGLTSRQVKIMRKLLSNKPAGLQGFDEKIYKNLYGILTWTSFFLLSLRI